MCKILHIDDSALQHMLVRRIFDKHMWDTFIIRQVSSISEATNALMTEDFDIIIADLNLPDSPRENTVSSIKALVPDTPIIAISCEDDIEVALQAVRDGVDCFINKSWEMKQLPYTVLTILEKRRIAKETQDSITNLIKKQTDKMAKSLTSNLERTLSLTKETSKKIERWKEQRALYG